MCSVHILKRHYFPFFWRNFLLQLYVFSIPKYKTTFNIHHFGELQIGKFGNFTGLHQTRSCHLHLVKWMLQDLDTWNSFSLFSWCEFVLFDQGFKLYPVSAAKEVPLCFATLLGIPFTSENSSSAQLLIALLFATTASHYSSLWLGDEPAHTNFSPPLPDLGGQAPSLYPKFLFASKAHVVNTPHHQILCRFYTSGSLASLWANVLLYPTLAMLPNSSPVPTFISTRILCWGHWLNTVPRTRPCLCSLRHIPASPLASALPPPFPSPSPLPVLDVRQRHPCHLHQQQLSQLSQLGGSSSRFWAPEFLPQPLHPAPAFVHNGPHW